MTSPASERAPRGHSRTEVLLGFDPAHSGDDVVDFGCAFARAIGAVPKVISVLPWPPGFLARYPQLRQELSDELAGGFGEIRHRCEGTPGIETEAIPGPSAAATLPELAQKEAVRAIVIGSAHRGLVGRVLAGSTGESLMHGAPKSIVIVPRGFAARGKHELRRIAVAFDGSAEAHRALETGVQLTRALGRGACLTLISVSDPPSYAYGADWPITVIDELDRASREHMQQLLDRALMRIPDGVEHEGRILEGRASRLLADASADYDLLLTGSRAHGPVRRTVLGSTTRSLIRTAECPVLVLPRGVGIDPLGLGSRGRAEADRSSPSPTRPQTAETA
jgi:nucleotide-binding universal stress UspA family protein